MFCFSLAFLTCIILLGWCTDPPVITKDHHLCHGDDEAWVADIISSGILQAVQRRRKMKPRSKNMAVINEGSVSKTSTE